MMRLEIRDRVVLNLDGVVSFDVWRCGRTVVDGFDAKKSGTSILLKFSLLSSCHNDR